MQVSFEAASLDDDHIYCIDEQLTDLIGIYVRQDRADIKVPHLIQLCSIFHLKYLR